MVFTLCAKQHPLNNKELSCVGNSYKNCGKPNQFAVCCQESKKKVLSMECESEEEEYVVVIAAEELLN